MFLYWNNEAGLGSFFRPLQTCSLLGAKLGKYIVTRVAAACPKFQGAVPRRALFTNFDRGTGEKTGFRKVP